MAAPTRRGRVRASATTAYVHLVGLTDPGPGLGLGAALGHQVSGNVIAGLRALGVQLPEGGDSRSIPDLATLPAPVRQVFEHAFGEATGHIFLLAAPVAAVALVAVLLIREVPLRRSIESRDELRRLSATGAAPLGRPDATLSQSAEGVPSAR